MCEINYIGKELDIFSHAVTWKKYFKCFISPYLGNNILEVGAGIGSVTEVLHTANCQKWTCLEPDAHLLRILNKKIENGILPGNCQTILGIISDIDRDELFDSVLYIDVLEHIKNDRDEATHAAGRLITGGKLIVLSPAHQFLYTSFDRAIRHYRRYTKTSLQAITPSGCSLERILYLDSMGLFLSLGNRLIMKQSIPTDRQIKFWSTYIVPISKIFDPLLGYRIGKSILAIWEKK